MHLSWVKLLTHTLSCFSPPAHLAPRCTETFPLCSPSSPPGRDCIFCRPIKAMEIPPGRWNCPRYPVTPITQCPVQGGPGRHLQASREHRYHRYRLCTPQPLRTAPEHFLLALGQFIPGPINTPHPSPQDWWTSAASSGQPPGTGLPARRDVPWALEVAVTLLSPCRPASSLGYGSKIPKWPQNPLHRCPPTQLRVSP